MSFTHLLTETITYKTPGSVDKWGTLGFGAAVTVPAAVEQNTRFFRGDEGNERESSHVIVTEVQIPEGSRVWIPGADTLDDEAAIVVMKSVAAPTRTTGLFMYESYLGVG